MACMRIIQDQGSEMSMMGVYALQRYSNEVLCHSQEGALRIEFISDRFFIVLRITPWPLCPLINISCSFADPIHLDLYGQWM